MEKPQEQESLPQKRIRLQNRYNQLEKERFELAMKDTWNDSDFREDDKMHQELLKIKKELETLYEQN